jgi:hypothetical protein
MIRAMLLAARVPAAAKMANRIADSVGSLHWYVFNSLRNHAAGRMQFYRSRAKH